MKDQMIAATKPLRIDRETDIRGCEDLLADLRARRSDTPLMLATEWKLGSRPGGVAAGAQTIITWARSQREALLITHSQPLYRDATLGNLCRRFHGIVGSMMASRVLEVDARTDVTKCVHGLVREHIIGMDNLSFQNLRGSSLPLFCVDHSTMRYLKPLYHQSEGRPVRDADDFIDLFKKLAPVAAPVGRDVLRSLALDLGVVLHELFENTHVHARTDADGNAYRRSVRGVVLAERSIFVDRIDDLGPGEPGLDDYLRSLPATSPDGDRCKVFEISVFDSGPGMAARQSAGRIDETMGVAEEADIVRSCFMTGASSRKRAGYGLGLPRVLSVLKRRGGYVAVRTGRVSLSRGFGPGSSNAPVTDAETVLLDAGAADGRMTRRQRMEGTTVTILVPLASS